MFEILLAATPVILKIIGWFYKDKEEKAEARVRFLKYIESHKNYRKKPEELHDRFEAIRKKIESERQEAPKE